MAIYSQLRTGTIQYASSLCYVGVCHLLIASGEVAEVGFLDRLTLPGNE